MTLGVRWGRILAGVADVADVLGAGRGDRVFSDEFPAAGAPERRDRLADDDVELLPGMGFADAESDVADAYAAVAADGAPSAVKSHV
ncbi:hypothetical protein [Auritidibacter ignavus]|uniref:hypothetical protein n=1 Tax=Auritidibacter ignavus TaxID=678932 RepID=UPI00109C715C|nr:hypothetical protein [Auritidibacter ignavus]